VQPSVESSTTPPRRQRLDRGRAQIPKEREEYAFADKSSLTNARYTRTINGKDRRR
jgi:hypothetical protein